jgi:hypothetical protein
MKRSNRSRRPDGDSGGADFAQIRTAFVAMVIMAGHGRIAGGGRQSSWLVLVVVEEQRVHFHWASEVAAPAGGAELSGRLIHCCDCSSKCFWTTTTMAENVDDVIANTGTLCANDQPLGDKRSGPSAWLAGGGAAINAPVS